MLIEELKKEHSILVQVLQDVKKQGIGSSSGKENLLKAKTTLLSHLKKEDDKLYPKLKEKAKTDANLQNILSTFAKDMEGVSKTALDFFTKYEMSDSEMEFAKDFGALYAALGNRIRKEENVLYAEYSKIP
ncbi:MAG: hemerythrin domain-containing protein [Leptospiraceae bacterium]|nr:hemerythrin domain-containing protein [Leptospiraceae bacterium]MCP5497480.1 hemerythrin domain-containing protein [Leptospiraceae bacterium]